MGQAQPDDSQWGICVDDAGAQLIQQRRQGSLRHRRSQPEQQDVLHVMDPVVIFNDVQIHALFERLDQRFLALEKDPDLPEPGFVGRRGFVLSPDERVVDGSQDAGHGATDGPFVERSGDFRIDARVDADADALVGKQSQNLRKAIILSSEGQPVAVHVHSGFRCLTEKRTQRQAEQEKTTELHDRFHHACPQLLFRGRPSAVRRPGRSLWMIPQRRIR